MKNNSRGPHPIGGFGSNSLVPADIDRDGDIDLARAHTPSQFWYDNRPIGDSNNDGVFDSSDLVKVLQAAEYKDNVQGNSKYDEGDWNGDGEFTTADLVFALQAGNYDDGEAALASELVAAVDWLHAQDDDAKNGRVFVA